MQLNNNQRNMNTQYLFNELLFGTHTTYLYILYVIINYYLNLKFI